MRTGHRRGEFYRSCLGRRDSFRQSKIHQLGARLGQHDVAGFQIAVDHASAMRLVQSFADLNAELQHLRQRQRAFAQAVGKSFAFEKLHDQIVSSILMANIVQSADVGMIQRRNRPCLALKALPGFGRREMRRKNLNRNRAIEAGVARAVNLAHAACTDGGDDFIGAELCARSEWHRVGVIIYGRLPWGLWRRDQRYSQLERQEFRS